MKPTAVLDSNLLLLYVVGISDRSLISVHKRLKAYTVSDFDLLIEIIERAHDVIVTPNTLTETSNLLGQIAEPARTKLFEAFRTLIQASQEVNYESKRASDSSVFVRLGLTDAALSEFCKGDIALITADFGLYQATLNHGGEAINFNHVREARGIV